MKAEIHPKTFLCKVSCTCGNSFEILSEQETLRTDLCSACHPFYSGQQKYVDAAGRVDKFTQRYKLNTDNLSAMAKKDMVKKPKAEKLQHKLNPKVKPTAKLPRDAKGAPGAAPAAAAPASEKKAEAAAPASAASAEAVKA